MSSSDEPLLARDGSDEPAHQGVALPPGAGLPGSPAGPDCRLQQLPLPPPLLAGSLLSLPLRAVPGPAQSLPNLLPPQTSRDAVVCGPPGVQWQCPPT